MPINTKSFEEIGYESYMHPFTLSIKSIMYILGKLETLSKHLVYAKRKD